jgi:FKBP-type peptidyl-prolyl cis-trans isomerase
MISNPLLSLPISLALVVGAARAQDPSPPIPADTEIATTESGLKYSVLQSGSGPRPKPGANVSVHYTGWLTDGTSFDSSRTRGQPIDFPLGQGAVIKGWDEGIALCQKGTRLKLTIPYELAYGEAGRPPTIPPKSTLIFEVELVDFQVLPELVAADAAKQIKLESGVVYQVLEAGEGETIPLGRMCEFEYALFTAAGDLVDTSVKRGGTVEDTCGQSQMPFMNEIMPLMKQGAWWRVDVPVKQAFGGRAVPQFPADSTAVWQLRIVEVKQPLPIPDFVALDAEKAVTTRTGLKYEVVSEGRADGQKPRLGQNVKVNYAGWLTDGTAFDSSFKRGEPAQFRLGGVITGWNEGLQLMGEGAVYRFEIPANLAYGAAGRPPAIPPDATLIFHIELVQVVP